MAQTLTRTQTMYVIVATHSFYGPTTTRDLVSDRDRMGRPALFETRAEAEEYLSDYDNGVYYTRHNETGRPSYEVRTVNSLPRYLADQI